MLRLSVTGANFWERKLDKSARKNCADWLQIDLSVESEACGQYFDVVRERRAARVYVARVVERLHTSAVAGIKLSLPSGKTSKFSA
ncbi:hypothetical protein D6817_05740 [Candidatus Pacearchaeota archaeon]|nr:MAG: hypothetical protein D6817_05740 [Candidatus Pacearchaeota archaeon]